MKRRDFLRASLSTMALLATYTRLSMAQSAIVPKRGGTFVMASADDAQQLNPFNPDIRVDKALQANIFDSLLMVDRSFKVKPSLARDYQVSKDSLTWTFKLRSGVKFHDGTAFTSKDVKYTFDWAKDPKNGAATSSLFQEVDSTAAVDDSTVRVTLKRPFGPFLRRVATHGIVPSGNHSRMGPDGFNKHPIGTGPYQFKDWQPGNMLVLQRSDGYWGGHAYFDQIVMRPIPEDSVRAIALRTGEAHTSVWPLTPGDTLELLKNPRVVGYRAPGLQLSHMQMNHANLLFQDKRTRQALMYALNRESMVKDIMRGLGTIATGNLSPAIPDYEPDVPKYNYNPTKARALLAQVGWAPGSDGILVNKDGKKFEITCLLIQGDQIRGPQAELAVSNFKDVGIKLNLERLEIGTYVDRVFKAGKYDLAFYNWPYGGTDGDPDAYAQLACGGSDNKSGWCNDPATRLLDEARTTSDAARRHALYSQFQKVFAEEVPFLYIMFWDDVAFFSGKLGGLPSPQEAKYVLSLVWDLNDYWFK